MCMMSGYSAAEAKDMKNMSAAILVKRDRARRRDAFDCIRDEVNELPADFSAWSGSLFDKLMFFRKESKSDYTAFCECGATVRLTKARTGTYTTCPECRSRVRLRDVRYPYHGQSVNIAYLQRTSEGWMQRLFIQYKTWEHAAEKTISVFMEQCEEERDHLDADGNYYEFHPSQTSRGKWRTGPGHVHGQGWSGWRVQNARIHTYQFNLELLFSNSPYKYSQLKTATLKSQINPFFYLIDYKKYPRQLEMIYKAGLYTLGEELLGYGSGWDGLERKIANATPKDLGIETKADLGEAAKFNCGYKELLARKRIRGWDMSPTDRLEAIKFMRALNSQSGEDFEYTFISNRRLFEYWMTQRKAFKRVEDFLHDYSDYVGNALTLEMNINDTKIKMPKDFKYCEQIVSARAAERQHQIKTAKARKKARSLKALLAGYAKQFAFADKNYAVVVPSCAEDLKKEGQDNNNCVYSYLDRILEHRSIILFLRRADAMDKSFCTVELEPTTFRLIQCRAVRNSAPPEDARKWIEKYAESLRKKAEKAA